MLEGRASAWMMMKRMMLWQIEYVCKDFLTEIVPYCNRWIQISIRKAMTAKDLDIRLVWHSYLVDIVGNE
jgi:hypothetical protein